MVDALIAIGSLCAAATLGIFMAVQNHKELQRTRDERVAIRRAYKKIKNAKLKAFYGIKDD